MKTYVTRAASVSQSEFAGRNLTEALDYVASRSSPGTPQLAIWWTSPRSKDGPDAVVCVPVSALVDCEARAAELVERWDAKWLVIESMPARHRDEARDDLRTAISSSLLEAVVKGMADGAVASEDYDDDF